MEFDLEEFLPYRLFQAAEHASRSFQSLYKSEFGITRTEWRVLFNIAQYGPISAREIIERTGLDKSVISRAVLSLESRNWIERHYSKSNRRTHQLNLSELGKVKSQELRKIAANFDLDLKSKFNPKEISSLMRILRNIEALK